MRISDVKQTVWRSDGVFAATKTIWESDSWSNFRDDERMSEALSEGAMAQTFDILTTMLAGIIHNGELLFRFRIWRVWIK